MYSHAVAGSFNALHGLEHSALGVFFAGIHGQGLTHATRSVHAGAARFVGEADVVGICKTIKQVQIREVRALAIVKADSHVLGRGGHKARGHNNQVNVEVKIHTQQGIFAAHNHVVASFTDFGHVSLGHHNAQAFLHLLVEAFQNAGDGHILIQDKGLTGVVGLFANRVG